jgi:hypothetical protein
MENIPRGDSQSQRGAHGKQERSPHGNPHRHHGRATVYGIFIRALRGGKGQA